MDDISYWYYYYVNGVKQQYNPANTLPANVQRFTNQLAKVDDTVPDTGTADYDKYNDVKKIYPNGSTGQVNGNYMYDAIGNLISHKVKSISNIGWSFYGKIS